MRRRYSTAIAFALAAWMLLVGAAHAQSVTSLTLDPGIVSGGTGASATGTVTLSAPAPAGGTSINLASSNTRLAAVQPSVTVPAGQTSASFVVGTNARYRRYSALAFSATITATNPAAASSASAQLSVTAQARPGPFTGGTHSADQNRRDGNICGGAVEAGSAVERGILYSCRFPDQGGFSVCSFLQECTFGCQHDPRFAAVGSPVTLQDSCAAVGPAPIALDPNPVVGGNTASGTLLLSTPAEAFSEAQVSTNPPLVSPLGNFPIPTGATSAPFEVATLETAVPTFLQTNASLFTNPLHRFAQDHLAVVPPADSAPPAEPLAVFSVALRPTSVVGGNSLLVIAVVSLNGVAPEGGAIVALSSDNAAASVPPSVTVPAGQTSAYVTVSTARVTAPTPARITATFGGVSRSATLTVEPPPAPVALAGITLNPPAVVGGNSSSGTVILDRSAPSGGTVVPLQTSHAIASLPASVTVPAGATTAAFTVTTTPVTASTAVTISANISFATQQATLTVSPNPPAVSLSSLSLNPTSVVGGNFRTSTGTVTLTGAAPSGGATVNLSRDNPAILVPAWITVPAGATIANFSVSTLAVDADTVATVIAGAGSVTRTAALTVRTSPLVSLTVNPTSVTGGDSSTGTVTLTNPAPAGGTVVALSDITDVTTLPASVTVPPGATTAAFTIATRPVTSTFSANLFADLQGVSKQALLTVLPSASLPSPPSLSTLTLSPTSVVGGNAASGTVTLSAAAPSAITVSLSDNSSAVGLPASVTVAAGSASASFTVSTSAVSASTSATITAAYNGTLRTAALTVTAATVPAPGRPSLLSPANDATVNQPVTLDWGDVANAASYQVQVDTSSTFSAPFVVDRIVTTSQITFSGLPAQRLWWRVRARNPNGVFGSFSSTRRFTPRATPAAASLASLSVSPASVIGPAASTGTATLSTAAPSGGAVVALTSNNAAATVPPTVTVAAGATSATFPIATSAVTASTSVTLTGTYGGITRSAALTINPPGAAATLAVNATGRSGERILSSPSGVNVATGSTGTATFTAGTSITLSVTDGRDAIWSGACSSGGDKRRTCTFTINGNASVTGNVR